MPGGTLHFTTNAAALSPQMVDIDSFAFHTTPQALVQHIRNFFGPSAQLCDHPVVIHGDWQAEMTCIAVSPYTMWIKHEYKTRLKDRLNLDNSAPKTMCHDSPKIFARAARAIDPKTLARALQACGVSNVVIAAYGLKSVRTDRFVEMCTSMQARKICVDIGRRYHTDGNIPLFHSAATGVKVWPMLGDTGRIVESALSPDPDREVSVVDDGQLRVQLSHDVEQQRSALKQAQEHFGDENKKWLHFGSIEATVSQAKLHSIEQEILEPSTNDADRVGHVSSKTARLVLYPEILHFVKLARFKWKNAPGDVRQLKRIVKYVDKLMQDMEQEQVHWGGWRLELRLLDLDSHVQVGRALDIVRGTDYKRYFNRPVFKMPVPFETYREGVKHALEAMAHFDMACGGSMLALNDVQAKSWAFLLNTLGLASSDIVENLTSEGNTWVHHSARYLYPTPEETVVHAHSTFDAMTEPQREQNIAEMLDVAAWRCGSKKGGGSLWSLTGLHGGKLQGVACRPERQEYALLVLRTYGSTWRTLVKMEAQRRRRAPARQPPAPPAVGSFSLAAPIQAAAARSSSSAGAPTRDAAAAARSSRSAAAPTQAAAARSSSSAGAPTRDAAAAARSSSSAAAPTQAAVARSSSSAAAPTRDAAAAARSSSSAAAPTQAAAARSSSSAAAPPLEADDDVTPAGPGSQYKTATDASRRKVIITWDEVPEPPGTSAKAARKSRPPQDEAAAMLDQIVWVRTPKLYWAWKNPDGTVNLKSYKAQNLACLALWTARGAAWGDFVMLTTP